MERIFTAEEMKACDTFTIEELGVPSASLMERAAAFCADEAERIYTQGRESMPRHEAEKYGPAVVVCGSGNNGGDGYACARILALRGIPVNIVHAGNPDHRTAETKRQAEICDRMGIEGLADPDFSDASVIVDALFGVGLSRPVTGRYAELISKINESGVPVVAVDIPSGIAADTGQVCGCAVRAASTVTMQRLKPGLLLYPGASYAGRVIRADIGVSTADSDCAVYRLSAKDAAELLPARREDGNKGTFGKILIIAGSYNMAGASYLSALAALRTGCGMVRILTADSNREILQSLLPEAMLATYRTTEEAVSELEKWNSWADTLVCGPGLGTGETAAALVKYVLTETEQPLVLDADGLNCISHNPDFLKDRNNVYITPHMGEMARLCGSSIPELKADPIAAARGFSAECGCTVILKDARTVTALPDGTAFLNTTGNSGLSTAGSGDVLSGILAGLLAQHADPVTAAPLAVFLHGTAGDIAASRLGERFMKAADIIEYLREAMRFEQKLPFTAADFSLVTVNCNE